MTVHAHISLKAGNHVHQPNTVVIPDDRKTFPVTVQWHIEADSTYVVAAPHKNASHAWCVLDDGLRQVSSGAGAGKKSVAAPKGAHPHISRTVQGGGAHNPTEMVVNLTGAELKSGHTYTLVCKRYDIIASTDFVAVSGKAAPKGASKKKAAKKKRKPAAKKKTKKKTARKAAKRKTAKRKPAKRKTAKRKTAKRKTAKKTSSRKKNARKKRAKKKSRR